MGHNEPCRAQFATASSVVLDYCISLSESIASPSFSRHVQRILHDALRALLAG